MRINNEWNNIMWSKYLSFAMSCLFLLSCSSMPDPVDVSPCLSKPSVDRYNCVFIAHNDWFEDIYEKHYPDGSRVKGRVTLVLSITRDGSVAEVHFGKSTLKSDSFEKELLAYVSKMNFGMNMAQNTIRIIDFPIFD